MKRVILSIIAVVAVALSASAQQKGDNYVGANIGYGTGKTFTTLTTTMGDDKITNKDSYLGGDSFRIGFEYGYFIADNLLLKANIGYGFDKLGSEIDHSLTVMPGIAYYVKLADKFYYTPNLSLGYVMGSSHIADEEAYTMHGFGAELQPLAVEFRPTKRFAMTVSLASLQYVVLSKTEKYEEYIDAKATVTSSGISFDMLKNAQVGFKLYF